MHYQTPFLRRDKFPNMQTAESFLAGCAKFARVVSERSGSADLERLWVDQPEGTLVLHLQHQMA